MQAAEQLPQSEGRIIERIPPPMNPEEGAARLKELRTKTDNIRNADLEDRRATLTQIYMRLNPTRSVDEADTLARRDILGGEDILVGERKLIESGQAVTIPEDEVKKARAAIREAQTAMSIKSSIQAGVLGEGKASKDTSAWERTLLGGQKTTGTTTFKNISPSQGESRAEPMSIGMKVPKPEAIVSPQENAAQERRRAAIARLAELHKEAKETKAIHQEVDDAFDRLTPTEEAPPQQPNQLH